jgi:hypothetical protein
MMIDPSEPNATSLTALNFLRSAQTRWHLKGPIDRVVVGVVVDSGSWVVVVVGGEMEVEVGEKM